MTQSGSRSCRRLGQGEGQARSGRRHSIIAAVSLREGVTVSETECEKDEGDEGGERSWDLGVAGGSGLAS